MKKIIILIASVLSTTTIIAQSLVGVSVNLGNTKIASANKPNYYRNTPVGYAFDINANLHLNTSKRFNPKVEFGFGQRSFLETFTAMYFGSNNQVLIYEDINTTTTLNKLQLNLGTRFNILNNKHKLFVDVMMGNNIIVSGKTVRAASNYTGAEQVSVAQKSSPYYVSFPISIGYNYNNKFSVAIFTNPAITAYDETFYSKRLNTYGLSLMCFLPVLGNKKASKE